ncbi:VOC family protein [Sphingomonas sp.]|uniref:VOC family protein n=1 Tax=Sphingomonas sp. TaxID=28214 RepID=UPI001B2D11D3|nr:VOC family protein [Sphingomonas sp.]MBO9714059.1 VOC family protein [Sphingomonas sp.]
MRQRLTQVALLVRDYDEAIGFYVGTLGFELVEDSDLGSDQHGGKRWVTVRPPGAGEDGMMILLARAATAEQARSIGDQAGGRVFLFLATDDFWRDHRAFAAKGVRFVREPAVEAYGTVAVFEDLYGNRWDLIGP